MRKAERELTKHTMMLFEGDFEKLQSFYPDVGASAVVRRLIESFLAQIESHGGQLDAKVEIKI